jgi:hypothetical protein
VVIAHRIEAIEDDDGERNMIAKDTGLVHPLRQQLERSVEVWASGDLIDRRTDLGVETGRCHITGIADEGDHTVDRAANSASRRVDLDPAETAIGGQLALEYRRGAPAKPGGDGRAESVTLVIRETRQNLVDPMRVPVAEEGTEPSIGVPGATVGAEEQHTGRNDIGELPEQRFRGAPRRRRHWFVVLHGSPSAGGGSV